jgi:hypothetical protein
MAAIAVSLLWWLFYAICLAGVLWLIIFGVKRFIWNDLPERLEQGIWFLYFLLCVIFLIGAFAGGGITAPHRLF